MSSDALELVCLDGLPADDPEALVTIIHRLHGLVVAQQAQIAELQTSNAELEARVAKLQKKLDDEQRKNRREAAPFRIPDEKRNRNPKKPGRRPGHQGAYRTKPDHVDAEISVPLEVCPHCQSKITDTEPIEQFIQEIPTPKVHVTRLVTHTGRCPKCGIVHSSHPLQVSSATGAAGTHLGPNATAVATDLVHNHKLSYRRVVSVLKTLHGLAISPGGLVQLCRRMGRKLTSLFADLCQQAREASVIHADETSWWVGGPGWWLWAFANGSITVYCVRDSRGRKIVHDILGADFAGVLVSDCLNIYDDTTPHQHKCYAHHLKAVSKMEQAHPETAAYCEDVRGLLKAAMIVKKMKPDLNPQTFEDMRSGLVQRSRGLFASPRASPEEERLANRFRKQLDHLFVFLDHEQVDATNNLAERRLRPAVISRKLSCGNRTPAGARTWEVLSSVAVTCANRAVSFRELVAFLAPLRSVACPIR